MSEITETWASDAGAVITEPTVGQQNAGFECGPADPGVFNWLFRQLTSDARKTKIYQTLSGAITAKDIGVLVVGDRVQILSFDADGAGGFTGIIEAANDATFPLGNSIRPLGFYVTPSMYGAKTGVVADYAPQVNAAYQFAGARNMDLVIDGFYRIGAPLIANRSGVRVRGTDATSTGLYPLAATTGNSIEVEASSNHISNMNLNMLGGGVSVYVYGAPWTTIDNNHFLDRNEGTGICIVLDDRDRNGVYVPGGYSHTIKDNNARLDGYSPLHFVKTEGTSGGVNNSYVIDNHVKCDRAVVWGYGGGNEFSNYILTGTGDLVTPVGTGYEFVNSGLQKIKGGYYEKLDAIYSVTSSGTIVTMEAFANDNCNSINRYLSGAAQKTPLMLSSNGIRDMRLDYDGTFFVSANGTAIDASRSFMKIHGNGAHRTACYLTTNLAREGDVVKIKGSTWAVELVQSTSCDFTFWGSRSMWFGIKGASLPGGVGAPPSGPQIQDATFEFDGAKWVLQDVTFYEDCKGSYGSHALTASNVSIPLVASTIELNGNGAARTGNTIDPPTVDDQRLTLLGLSWSVQIIQDAVVKLEGGAAMTFGNASGNVRVAEFMGRNGVWYEVSRSTV